MSFGGDVSVTVIVKAQLATRSAKSYVLQVTVVTPSRKELPDATEQVVLRMPYPESEAVGKANATLAAAVVFVFVALAMLVGHAMVGGAVGCEDKEVESRIDLLMSLAAKQRWSVPRVWRVSVVLHVTHSVQSIDDVAMQPAAVDA